VIRYSILYFIMLVLFVVLVAGPLVGGRYVKGFSIPDNLAQPTGFNNNDTFSSETGTGVNGGIGAAAAATSSAAAASTGGSALTARGVWEVKYV